MKNNKEYISGEIKNKIVQCAGSRTFVDASYEVFEGFGGKT